MTEPALNVIFLWHMHQPDYRDPESDLSLLPWVRLHGVKDYLDMVTILDDFPGVRQNFNLVPSLLDQLQGYVDGTLSDQAYVLTRKNAANLSLEDKTAILKTFFHAHWDNMVKPYPRYWELLRLRGFHPASEALSEVQRYFSEQDFRDLQVWYNLTWIDPVFRQEYPDIGQMISKQRNFSETEKLKLLDLQLEIISRIIPAYREREERGQIELSTTPYYHPILPLLYDTSLASVSQPHDPLPGLRFAHPEDVEMQIKKALNRHRDCFGRYPRGMWPSEGAVCQELIPYFHRAGIKWIATDEGILANSTIAGGEHTPLDAYRAWSAVEGESRVEMIFRDHQLSDLIGFVYSHWNEKQAADDFISRLQEVRRRLGSRAGNSAVAIILDGENAWEHFPRDGADFLRELYARLQDTPGLSTNTVSGYLEGRPAGESRISWLYPGSWINANFRIWIGHTEDNLAWEYLGRARRALVLFEERKRQELAPGGEESAAGENNLSEKLKDKIKKAWEHIYIAEGSDWCWWYGDDHSSENDADFDELFRRHLMAVYRLTDQEIPEYLFRPIIQADKILHPENEISSFIDPRIDGRLGSYFEWRGAALCKVASLGGAMHRTEYLIKELYYGFNLENFFLRLDISRKVARDENCYPGLFLINHHQEKFRVRFTGQSDDDLILTFEDLNQDKKLVIGESGKSDAEEPELRFALQEIFELAIPFAALRAPVGTDLNFAVTIEQDNFEVQRIPAGGYLRLVVPGPDFEERMWYV
ncbi:MAG: hypothetical protein GXO34_04405 [Deltaproteobacteria bacterium]|nr:hypothetical protein [Deltaproteobacteria bacterium]